MTLLHKEAPVIHLPGLLFAGSLATARAGCV